MITRDVNGDESVIRQVPGFDIKVICRFECRSTGPLPPNVETKGDCLLITHVDYSLNGTWVCEATNALGKGSGKVTVVVKEAVSTSAGTSAHKPSPTVRGVST